MYPEAYRKSDYVKGSNTDAPAPFKIGYIAKIYQSNKKSSKPKVIVNKFYRPEDTHRNVDYTHTLDLNLLYWSDEGMVYCALRYKLILSYNLLIQ